VKAALLQIESETRLEPKVDDFESERLEIISHEAIPALVPSPSDETTTRFDPAWRAVGPKLHFNEAPESKRNVKLDLA
jgi:hypothetical protein